MTELKVADANFGSVQERELATMKIGKLFIKFAVPGVIGLLFIGIQSIIDGIILGNFVGANALASVSLAIPAINLMSALSIVMGIGCQTVVSMSLGQMNYKGANDALTTGFTSLVSFSVVMAIGLTIFARPIAVFLGANNALIEDSVTYIQTLSPFFPMFAMMFLGDYMLKSLGRPVYAVSVMSGTVILNIVLDLLFIAQFGWGTMGAALATGIAFSLGACCTIPILMRRSGIVSIFGGKVRFGLLWRMLYNGSSEGISELSAGITLFLFNRAMMYYLGESGVAALMAVEYVLYIGITVFLGVSDGIIPIISYNYGAKQKGRIKSVLRLAIKTNCIIGLTLFASLLLFGEHVVSLFFKTNDVNVLEIAAGGTAICAFSFLLNGLNILFSSYFTALGDAKTSVIISLLRGLVFVAIGIAVLPQLFGITGIWFAIPIAELLTFGVAVVLMKRSKHTKFT